MLATLGNQVTRTIYLLCITLMLCPSTLWAGNANETDASSNTDEQAGCAALFDHSMRQLHSQQQIDLCALTQGKPVLVVNTASHCGFTPQFKSLEALHKSYQERGLVVIGFASDDFNQEAKNEKAAANICYNNYGVSFIMLAPSSVKGKQANPTFKVLGEKSTPPNWNFNKYLVSASGQTIKHFGSSVEPTSSEIIEAIHTALNIESAALSN